MELYNDARADYQPILLLPNVCYPTFQLRVLAGRRGAAPETVLKIVVLETAKWLRQRFRAFELPPELDMPDPEQHGCFELASLRSFHLNLGYKLQVVWLHQLGIWTLQLTEPDLGTRPGVANQQRPPVPGRLFETNISYRVTDQGVDCGFKTVVHEPEGTDVFCEVFRLAFIKYLARNPLVGLSQTWPLLDEPHLLSGPRELKRLKRWLDDDTRSLPAVIVAACEPSPAAAAPAAAPHVLARTTPPALDDIRPPLGLDTAPFGFLRGMDVQLAPPDKAAPPAEIQSSALPLDIADLARYRMGYAMFFLLPTAQLDAFAKACEYNIAAGGIIVVEPSALGGNVTVYDHDSISRHPEKALAELEEFIQNYPKRKAVSFDGCVFIPQARNLEREAILRLHSSKEEMAASFAEKWDERELEFRENLSRCETMLRDSEARVDRRDAQIEELAKDKLSLVRLAEQAELRYSRQMAAKDDEIRHLQSLLTRPKKPDQVEAWARDNFAGRLIFHERAVDEMRKLRPAEADLPLICDALEYLACEYRDELLGIIDEAELGCLCARKYGRPFQVIPTKGLSIDMYPNNYKIKYAIGFKGKPIETVLDLHLKVGNDSESLLRIYFLFDKKEKLIVIGSLPKHLKTRSYQ